MGEVKGQYLRATKEGQELYEKSGWKSVGMLELDLSELGRQGEVVRSWNMICEGGGRR